MSVNHGWGIFGMVTHYHLLYIVKLTKFGFMQYPPTPMEDGTLVILFSVRVNRRFSPELL